MATKQLYALVLPDVNQDRARGSQRRNQATSGTLGGGTGSVESISLQPGEKRLAGAYVNQYAEEMALQVEELFGAPGIEEVPYTLKSGSSPEDGYYTLRDVEPRAEVPPERRVQRFEGAITRKGDKSERYRAVTTNVQTVDNPFGSTTTADLGLHTDATKVRWMDPAGGAVEDATVQSTITGEHGDIDRYDATNSSFTDPTLLYELPYADEWKGDVRVWDNYGRSKTDTIDGTTIPVTWQRVYKPDHDFQGLASVETQKLRVAFDLSVPGISALRWDSGSSTYSAVSLGSSSWQLYDYRFTRIGLERIVMRVEFEDSNTADTYYRLDATFNRGNNNVLWTKPPNAGTIPSGLDTLLSPIADDSDRDATTTATTIPKDEVST